MHISLDICIFNSFEIKRGREQRSERAERLPVLRERCRVLPRERAQTTPRFRFEIEMRLSRFVERPASSTACISACCRWFASKFAALYAVNNSTGSCARLMSIDVRNVFTIVNAHGIIANLQIFWSRVIFSERKEAWQFWINSNFCNSSFKMIRTKSVILARYSQLNYIKKRKVKWVKLQFRIILKTQNNRPAN